MLVLVRRVRRLTGLQRRDVDLELVERRRPLADDLPHGAPLVRLRGRRIPVEDGRMDRRLLGRHDGRTKRHTHERHCQLTSCHHFLNLCAGPHIFHCAWGPTPGALARALRSLGLKAATHLSRLAHFLMLAGPHPRSPRSRVRARESRRRSPRYPIHLLLRNRVMTVRSLPACAALRRDIRSIR